MKRILAIDDETEITDWIREIFEGEGYCVETVNGGIEAVRRGDETGFDVIITDIKMPGLNGAEVIKKMRQGMNASTPIIVLTGSPDCQTTKLVESLKPFAWIDKPFGLNAIIEIVHQAIQSRLRE
ncbi:MAG: response regulator [Candidatus Omnitrophica bacterium]|nr:response regulator [Candidatus Omnitrophota bacterium]